MNVPGLRVAFLCAVFGGPGFFHLEVSPFLVLCHLHPTGRKGKCECGGTAALQSLGSQLVQVASARVSLPGALSRGHI